MKALTTIARALFSATKRWKKIRWTIVGLCGIWATLRLLVASGTLIDLQRFVPTSDGYAVTDRTGLSLRLARVDGADRRWVRIQEVPSVLVQAVLATEDARFFSHDGIDRSAIARAVVDNVVPGRTRTGGSTITQQLVKKVYGRPHGIWSKFLEALRAMTLDRRMSKDEVLEQYLNRLPYSEGIEGVARACESYFGHELASLTLTEAALLAGIPRAPSALDPRRFAARSNTRRRWVLGRMRTVGVIDESAYVRALAEEPRIATTTGRPWVAPRFVDRVLSEVQRGLIQREQDRTLRTSLDSTLQTTTEDLLRTQWQQYTAHGARNAAAIVVANHTGEILAYVGAVDPTAEGGALDLLTAQRQPGSTLKPFTYELFFERGGTAATVLNDVQIAMTGAQGEQFEARDYDATERGPVSARTALTASLNLAALDVARRVGQDRLAARMQQLGFEGVESGAAHGGALVLGGIGVTAVQIAQAYLTLARGGTRVRLRSTVSAVPQGIERILAPTHTALTWDILADPEARQAGFGDDLRDLAPNLRFALKTGTSPLWRDAWCAVSTSRVTVVVWLGDPSGQAMDEVSGYRAAAPAAVRIAASADARAQTLGIPQVEQQHVPFVIADVCPLSGLRAGPHCGDVGNERFVPGTVPEQTCAQHDDHGNWIAPEVLRPWAEQGHHPGIIFATPSGAPTGRFVVREPSDGAHWILDHRRGAVSLPLRATLDRVEVRAAQWSIDGAVVEGNRWTPTDGTHTIVAILAGRRSEPSHVTVILR